MGTKYKCETHLCFIYSLWIYRFYLGYKNILGVEFNYNLKLRIEFIYKYLHLHSIVFVSKISDFGGFRISEFRTRDIQPVIGKLEE
jgi:hypothetical protein